LFQFHIITFILNIFTLLEKTTVLQHCEFYEILYQFIWIEVARIKARPTVFPYHDAAKCWCDVAGLASKALVSWPLHETKNALTVMQKHTAFVEDNQNWQAGGVSGN